MEVSYAQTKPESSFEHDNCCHILLDAQLPAFNVVYQAWTWSFGCHQCHNDDNTNEYSDAHDRHVLTSLWLECGPQPERRHKQPPQRGRGCLRQRCLGSGIFFRA